MEEKKRMELFKNLIYEYKKGVRDMILYTCKTSDFEKYREIMNLTKIPYHTEHIGQNKCNIYFGNPKCLNILKNFSSTDLNKITPEEDFILGIMLGYSRKEQYSRVLKRKIFFIRQLSKSPE